MGVIISVTLLIGSCTISEHVCKTAGIEKDLSAEEIRKVCVTH